jgi:hypothetical protein
MHTMPETLTSLIETALAQAKYDGDAVTAYLLEVALKAASEPAKTGCRVDRSETGQDYRPVAA